jgi:hypothetical protein
LKSDVPGSDQHIADVFLEKLPFSHGFPFNLPRFRPPQRRDVPFGKPTGALAVERFGEIG